MTTKVAIIGSGPTGIYTLHGLVRSAVPLSITIFEVEADAGKGTPYHPDINDQAMLANIASIELPPICETLVEWLRRQPDAELQRLNVASANIREREFYPRVVLGEFLQSQFQQLIEIGIARGHSIDVKSRHRVVDIRLREADIQLEVTMPDGARKDYAFDHVVMATGHNWPESTEIRPGYFMSPWPAPALKTIGPCHVGILGTSLSAIDALITVATAHGVFYLDAGGRLQYQASADGEGFHAALMSRKGLLPEADFYCEYPYTPLQVCTPEAVNALIERGCANLLDDVFELFRAELVACDPDYAAKIGLALVTVDTLADAYFAEREAADPFTWAAANLAEAEQNKRDHYTVPWRYAILRMHEIIARAVPHLDQDDLKRFHGKFKSVFVDDYATVPHQSIQRLLALRRAGRLEILKLGRDYKLDADGVARGAAVHFDGRRVAFDAFIDATGQASMSARDMPFPGLIEQGVIKQAATPEGVLILDESDEAAFTRTGGIDLDAAFRPKFAANLCNRLYCAAISFLLHKLPFVQGITSAHEIGEVVSKAILDDVSADQREPALMLDDA
ncbi:FAD/NAD(P)-binding protein [Rhodopseudomonas sp. RCAM05734]|uniref:FAD/NAD(P)-binding protein n=1 Tax=Rhodopseudomonas sp. RCAM05734 TaxID=3457549 RepID=UPI00404407C4